MKSIVFLRGLDNKCSVFPVYSTMHTTPSSASLASSVTKLQNDGVTTNPLQQRKVVAMHTSYVSACSFTHSDHQVSKCRIKFFM